MTGSSCLSVIRNTSYGNGPDGIMDTLHQTATNTLTSTDKQLTFAMIILKRITCGVKNMSKTNNNIMTSLQMNRLN